MEILNSTHFLRCLDTCHNSARPTLNTVPFIIYTSFHLGRNYPLSKWMHTVAEGAFDILHLHFLNCKLSKFGNNKVA